MITVHKNEIIKIHHGCGLTGVTDVVLSLFGTLAFLPRWQRLSARHYIMGGVVLASVAFFYLLLFKSLKHANDKLIPHLMELEQKGPR
jgi:hypothetical protein